MSGAVKDVQSREGVVSSRRGRKGDEETIGREK
jgi:hypothetical protein